MSQFSKFVVFGSGVLAATYLIYRFLKSRNKDEVPATDTEVADFVDEVNDDDGFEQHIIKSDSEDAVENDDVRAEGVFLWVDQCVAEYYSLNPGPSSHVHIKQDILDYLVKSDLGNDINEENVKSYIQDYLRRERNVYIQKIPSSDISSIPSSDVNRVPDECSSDEDSFDVDQEIDYMCHHYFGITRDEYMALEEDVAKKLIEKEKSSTDIMSESSQVSSGLHQKEKDVISSKVSEESARTLDALDKKDNEIEKKKKKGWKKFKTRVTKFFKRDKDSKTK